MAHPTSFSLNSRPTPVYTLPERIPAHVPVWPPGSRANAVNTRPKTELLNPSQTLRINALQEKMKALQSAGYSTDNWRYQKLYNEIRQIEGNAWPAPMMGFFVNRLFDPNVFRIIQGFAPVEVVKFSQDAAVNAAAAAPQGGPENIKARPAIAPILNFLSREHYDPNVWKLVECHAPSETTAFKKVHFIKVFQKAVRENDLGKIQVMINHPSIQQLTKGDVENLWQLAFKNNRSEVVGLFVQSSKFQKISDDFLEFLIGSAVECSHFDVLDEYFKHTNSGALTTNAYNLPALRFKVLLEAVKSGQIGLIKTLVNGELSRRFSSESLLEAYRIGAKYGQADAMQMLIAHEDFSVFHKASDTLLKHYAVPSGQQDAFKRALDFSDLKLRLKNTLAFKEHIEIYMMLHQKGFCSEASKKLFYNHQVSELFVYAARTGNIEAIQTILDSDSKRVSKEDYERAREKATTYNQPIVLEVLSKYDAFRQAN